MMDPNSIMEIVDKHPWFAHMLMIMGGLRLALKPIFTALESYIASTPSKSDDERWERIKSNKMFGIIIWFLDYFASVKLDKIPKAIRKNTTC